MEPYQERVVAEKAELDEKIEKLTTFIWGLAFTKLPDKERVLLSSQRFHMISLSVILGERIASFNLS
jgi:hypothetical protein